jgi:hypothetical protein
MSVMADMRLERMRDDNPIRENHTVLASSALWGNHRSDFAFVGTHYATREGLRLTVSRLGATVDADILGTSGEQCDGTPC